MKTAKKIIPITLTFTESLRATILLSLPAIIAVALIAIVGLFLIGSTGGCSASETRQGAKTVIHLADAVCEAAESDGDPEWQKVVCKYIDDADKVSKIFLVRVPKRTFAATTKPCPSTSTSK